MKKEIIWAPWRMGYINTIKKKSCFLCYSFRSKKDEENFVVYRGNHSFVIMNIYPYNNGHLMVSPVRHIKSITSLKKEEEVEIMELIKKSVKVLKKVINPDGFNIGLNLGRTAGAGLENHIHFHIVPRWNGDTNFMPVISNTKVIPQSLQELYYILAKEFKK